MTLPKIGILGCGWLGLPLAKELIHEGYTVFGTTTSTEKIPILQNAGINPFLLKIETSPTTITSDFFIYPEVFILNIPPQRQETVEKEYLQQMQTIAKALPQNKTFKLIFISSTSVYGEEQGLVTEETTPQPNKASGKALYQAEQFWQKNFKKETTILRLAGLIGDQTLGTDRSFDKILLKQRTPKNMKAPVNLIHIKDSIAVIKSILRKEVYETILNVCCDTHPLRQELYALAAQKIGMDFPLTPDAKIKINYKIVSNQKLKETLGADFRLQYPCPKDTI